MPHPKCIRSVKKTPLWNKKLVERGIPHIPNRKGAVQKAWIAAPYQKWPKKCPSPITKTLHGAHSMNKDTLPSKKKNQPTSPQPKTQHQSSETEP